MSQWKIVALLWILGVILAARVAIAAPPDDSTPKGAAKALYSALAEGDWAAAKKVTIVADGYSDAFKTLVDYGVGFTRLADAVTAKFGKAAADEFPSPGKRLAVITDATETDNGDTALLIPADGNDPLHMKLVAGHWKVDIFANPAFNGPEAMAKGLRLIAAAANATADDTAAGKYKSTAEVQAALVERLKKALTPTTGPTTEPAAGAAPPAH
jgi:hypothetical protein